MKRQMRMVVANGQEVLVTVDDGDVEREVSEQTTRVRFAEALSGIEGMCQDFSAALERIAPDSAKVEFGIDLSLETSGLTALLTKGSAEASFSIELEWKRPSPQPAKGG
jgi:hypothetical protein